MAAPTHIFICRGLRHDGGRVQLEYKLVRELTLGKAEASFKVLRKIICLLDFFDESFVDVLLIRRFRFRIRLFRFGLAISEELLLCGYARSRTGFVEVRVVDFFIDLEITQVDPGRCGNHIRLVDSPKGYTIDFVRTSDQEEAGSELLEENNTLATESPSKKNKDGSGGNRAS